MKPAASTASGKGTATEDLQQGSGIGADGEIGRLADVELPRQNPISRL